MSTIDEYKRRHRERRRQAMERVIPADKYDTRPEMVRPYVSPYRLDEQREQAPVKRIKSGRRFLVQLVLSGLLVACVYGVHTSKQSFMKPVDQSLQTAMTQEFQFAAVSSWYQKNLGDPISFLPGNLAGKKSGSGANSLTASSANQKFAEPVTGEVTAPYSSKTKGVTVKTTANESVKAVQDGLVIFAGTKKGTGQTIVIQHKDHSESWYGHLDKVTVKIYQEVTKGEKIGITSGGKNGSFYFALKKGAKFIDPIQVMSFD
ncbi:MAG: M23 family metallopeptidase [Sporolactobacillus sp.]